MTWGDVTSLSASLGISAPESAGRALRSWGLAGSDANWTGPSFYNVPRALDVIQREKKAQRRRCLGHALSLLLLLS